MNDESRICRTHFFKFKHVENPGKVLFELRGKQDINKGKKNSKHLLLHRDPPAVLPKFFAQVLAYALRSANSRIFTPALESRKTHSRGSLDHRTFHTRSRGSVYAPIPQ